MDENLESTQDAGATKHNLIQLLIYNPNIELIQLFLMEFCCLWLNHIKSVTSFNDDICT